MEDPFLQKIFVLKEFYDDCKRKNINFRGSSGLEGAMKWPLLQFGVHI